MTDRELMENILSEIQGVKADIKSINSDINHIKGDVEALRKDLTKVEVITSSNWNEIAKLKLVK